MKPEELSISGELFTEMRSQINHALNACIRKMREVGSDEGTVGVKIHFEILDDEAVTNGAGRSKRMDTLKIEGKVTMAVPVKGETKMPTKVGIKCVSHHDGYQVMDGQISVDELLKDTEEDDDDDC